MNTSKNEKREDDLAAALRNMNTQHAENIRQAYYKAVEGLQSLASALERAELNGVTGEAPLAREYLIACKAIKAMDKSLLGKTL
jgi:hypothetical protein